MFWGGKKKETSERLAHSQRKSRTRLRVKNVVPLTEQKSIPVHCEHQVSETVVIVLAWPRFG
jgi:hypothetical protein